jgi:hypothetical protein
MHITSRILAFFFMCIYLQRDVAACLAHAVRVEYEHAQVPFVERLRQVKASTVVLGWTFNKQSSSAASVVAVMEIAYIQLSSAFYRSHLSIKMTTQAVRATWSIHPCGLVEKLNNTQKSAVHIFRTCVHKLITHTLEECPFCRSTHGCSMCDFTWPPLIAANR